MNADGTGVVRLTNNAAADTDVNPSWSPDGTQIVFTSTRDGGLRAIYVMNADGTGQINVTDNIVFDNWPKWSPDGQKITFMSTRDGNQEIYIMNADGSGQTNISNNAGTDTRPDWGNAPDTPNTAPVANDDVFTTQFETAINNLNVLANDTDAEFHPLTITAVTTPINSGIATINATNTGIDFTPANEFRGVDRFNYTASDGNGGFDDATVDVVILDSNGKISFTSLRDGNPEIYVMNTDGIFQTRLTNDALNDEFSNWSPNGTKIAFTAGRDGNNEIYVDIHTERETHTERCREKMHRQSENVKDWH